MEKDPAVLFYINDWLTSTAEMDADARGWFLNLILHHYDKGSLPADLEKLAVLAGVKFSEFKRFKQVFEQVLQQKFGQSTDGRLTNLRAATIIKKRELFKEKRSDSGKKSYMIRFFQKRFSDELKDEHLFNYIKANVQTNTYTKSEQMLEQVFKHLCELYRNENENENINKIDREGVGEKEPKTKKFTPPSEAEVKAYISEMSYVNLSAIAFISYYQSKGWKIGNAPMKDWKAAVRTWAHRPNAPTISKSITNDKDVNEIWDQK